MKALMVGVFGARGTGKNAWTLQQLAREKPPRLLVWDHKHDPTMASLGTAHADLGGFIRAIRGQRFALRYLPDHGKDLKAQFDLFCKAAFAAGNVTMVVDELPEVTSAHRAPPAWRTCSNVGRDYTTPDGKRAALAIWGLGQRPSEVDLSFRNNLDVLHTGRVASMADAKVLADLLAVDYRRIQQLPDLAWIERRQGQITATEGRLSFGRNVAPSKPRTPSRGSL